MDSLKTIKRNGQIAQAFSKARAFYKENGFMDLTRFSSYFKQVKFDSEEHKIHAITNWYLLFNDTLKEI